MIIVLLFCMLSFCLFSSDTYTLTHLAKTSDDLELVNGLMDLGIVENIIVQADLMTLEFSSDCLCNFRRGRTIELELIRKELLVLQGMLYNVYYCRTDDKKNRIQSFILLNQRLIPQREHEEQLSNIEFFNMYSGNLSKLQDDICATTTRLSGIRSFVAKRVDEP